MVAFLPLFTKNLHFVYFFVNKNGVFHPAGGEISFWIRNRITRVTDKTYAVVVQTGWLIRWKPAAPAAAWPGVGFFAKR
jgi:hypothetical protein